MKKQKIKTEQNETLLNLKLFFTKEEIKNSVLNLIQDSIIIHTNIGSQHYRAKFFSNILINFIYENYDTINLKLINSFINVDFFLKEAFKSNKDGKNNLEIFEHLSSVPGLDISKKIQTELCVWNYWISVLVN